MSSGWADDAMLRPWRRGGLDLPFTTSERSSREQFHRLIAIVLGTGAIICVIIFAMLVTFGLVPELHRDPRITGGSPDPWFVAKVTLGSGGIGALALAVILGPIMSQGPTGPGHPLSLTASEGGLSITTAEGETIAGAWADWRLVEYFTTVVARNVPVIQTLVLAHGDRTFQVELLTVRHQRKLLKAVARKLAA
jgi:hypothetical protein